MLAAVLQEHQAPTLHAALKADQLRGAGNLKGKALTAGDKHILSPTCNSAAAAGATGWWRCRGAHSTTKYCCQKVRWKRWGWSGGTPSVPELPQILRDIPQISQAAKRHLTFPALKEYDSREADGENRESSKRGGRQKPHKVQAATKTVSLQSPSLIPLAETV